MRVAITGANGFIGSHLCRAWAAEGLELVPLQRPQLQLDQPFELEPALQGVQVLVHAAARAHVMREHQADPLARYRLVNGAATRRLAQQAARAGVRRLVLLSSIGVLGSTTQGRAPFTAADLPAPQEPYAVSKWEAEQAARAVAEATGMELVVVRPPLVMGAGVKGNLLRLLRLVEAGWLLPFGAVANRRSFVGLDNLTALLRLVLEHPAAAGGSFLVADGHDLSTPALLRRLAAALGRRSRLVAVPPVWLRAGGGLLGHGDQVSRLLESLQVDAGGTIQQLGWRPVAGVDQGLAAMARAYRQGLGPGRP